MATAKLIPWPVGLIASGHGRFARLLAFSIALSCWATGVSAKPVTFAFEAEVTSIAPSSATEFNVPLHIEIGDVIHGSFTFESANSGPIDRDSLKLRFELPTSILEKAGHNLLIANDSVAVIGSSASEPFDSISVSCPSATCDAGMVPGHEHLQWRPLLNLMGEHTILDGQHLPNDITIWNAFSQRQLRLSFEPGGFIEADVGLFSAVPEPSTTALFASVFFAQMFSSHRLRHGAKRQAYLIRIAP